MTINQFRLALGIFAATLALGASPGWALQEVAGAKSMDAFEIRGSDGVALTATPLSSFSSAWAMAFLPDGRAVVTEREGPVWLINGDGTKAGQIGNSPAVKPLGQGGMGDFIVHPDFAENATVFLSYIHRDPEDDTLSGAVVERATLTVGQDGGAFENREIIWRQKPLVRGNGHYGHRLEIGPKGHLFITSGDRQKFTYAQNMAANLGKVIRINQDGSVPEDNPFFGNGGIADQIWTLGHRNPLGIDFDAEGRLWSHEMGPRHGDEVNLIVRAENYGYPIVSNGNHYTGTEIPDHADNPVYFGPAAFWVPAISPAGFDIYDGEMFADWQGDGFVGGLSSRALVRVSFDEDAIDTLVSTAKERQEPGAAKEVARYEWGERVREIEEGPDGAIYILEDKAGGRLLRLTPEAT